MSAGIQLVENGTVVLLVTESQQMHLCSARTNRAVLVVKHAVKDRIGEFHSGKGGEERLDATGTKESAKILPGDGCFCRVQALP